MTCEDNPPGHSEPVDMFKDNLSICKRCFYSKRGSLDNMSTSDLIMHLQNNPDFEDKFLWL